MGHAHQKRTLEDYFREFDRKRWRELGKGVVILFGYGGLLGIGLGYSGREAISCDRYPEGITCQIERTYWLGQVSGSPRRLKQVSQVEIQPAYSIDTNDAYFLQTPQERYQLELIDWHGVQQLHTFLETPNKTTITVERSTTDLLLDSAITGGLTLLGLGVILSSGLAILWRWRRASSVV